MVVLDDTSDSLLWIVRKADIIGRVHKKYLQPIDRTSIEVHYMNSKRQDHFSAHHQIESVSMILLSLSPTHLSLTLL